MPYSVNKDTTKDEVLIKKERTRRKNYLQKFERKRMINFMCSELKMREKEIDQDAEIQDTLDYLSDIHNSLQDIETNHHCYYLVRIETVKESRKTQFLIEFIFIAKWLVLYPLGYSVAEWCTTYLQLHSTNIQ